MRRIPFWRAADAVARITRKLAERCGGGDLGVFLPTVDAKFKRTSPAMGDRVVATLYRVTSPEDVTLLNRKPPVRQAWMRTV